MQWIVEAIERVNSELSLAAFVVACVLYAFIKWLRYKEKKGKAELDAKNEVQLKLIANQQGIETGKLNAEGVRSLLSQHISARTHRLVIYLVGFIVLCLILAGVALASMFLGPARTPQVKLGGELASVAEGINMDGSGPTITLAGPVRDVWIPEIAAPTMTELVQKLCASNPCLSCESSVVSGAENVRIGQGKGPIEQFTGLNGASYRRCG